MAFTHPRQTHRLHESIKKQRIVIQLSINSEHNYFEGTTTDQQFYLSFAESNRTFSREQKTRIGTEMFKEDTTIPTPLLCAGYFFRCWTLPSHFLVRITIETRFLLISPCEIAQICNLQVSRDKIR